MPRIKISQAAKEFNVSIPTVVEQLQKKGISIDANPNTRIDEAAYNVLVEAFQPDRKERERIERMRQDKEKDKAEPVVAAAPKADAVTEVAAATKGPRVIGKIELDSRNNPIVSKPEEKDAPKAEAPKAEDVKPAVPEKPAEAPKAEATKAEAPKAEEVKPAEPEEKEAPKAEAPKAEEVKPAEPERSEEHTSELQSQR